MRKKISTIKDGDNSISKHAKDLTELFAKVLGLDYNYYDSNGNGYAQLFPKNSEDKSNEKILSIIWHNYSGEALLIEKYPDNMKPSIEKNIEKILETLGSKYNISKAGNTIIFDKK
ncbi:MAG: hypothetical protein ACP5LH_01565 [Candidatus Micrarchaeia archaeon]